MEPSNQASRRHSPDAEKTLLGSIKYMRGCVTDAEISALANEMAADEKEQTT